MLCRKFVWLEKSTLRLNTTLLWDTKASRTTSSFNSPAVFRPNRIRVDFPCDQLSIWHKRQCLDCFTLDRFQSISSFFCVVFSHIRQTENKRLNMHKRKWTSSSHPLISKTAETPFVSTSRFSCGQTEIINASGEFMTPWLFAVHFKKVQLAKHVILSQHTICMWWGRIYKQKDMIARTCSRCFWGTIGQQCTLDIKIRVIVSEVCKSHFQKKTIIISSAESGATATARKYLMSGCFVHVVFVEDKNKFRLDNQCQCHRPSWLSGWARINHKRVVVSSRVHAKTGKHRFGRWHVGRNVIEAFQWSSARKSCGGYTSIESPATWNHWQMCHC